MTRRRHTPEQIVRKLTEADRMLNEGSDVDASISQVVAKIPLLAHDDVTPFTTRVEQRGLERPWRHGSSEISGREVECVRKGTSPDCQ